MDQEKVSAIVQGACSKAVTKGEREFYELAGKVLGGSEARRVKDVAYLKSQKRSIVIPTRSLKLFHRAVARLFYTTGVCKFNSAAIGSIKYRSRQDIVSDSYRRYVASECREDTKDLILIRMDIRKAFYNTPAYKVEEVLVSAIDTMLRDLVQMYSKPSNSMSSLPWTVRMPLAEFLAHDTKDSCYYRKALFLRNVLPALVDATTYKGRLPVGFSLSPLIFNLSIKSIDGRIAGAIRTMGDRNNGLLDLSYTHKSPNATPWQRPLTKVVIGGGMYYRYVDDLVIITPRANVGLVKIIRSIAWSEGLEMNERKTKVIPYASGWTALGMTLSDPLCKPSKRFLKKARGLWHRYQMHNDKKAYEILRGMIASCVPKGATNSSILDKLGIKLDIHGRKGKWDLVSKDDKTS